MTPPTCPFKQGEAPENVPHQVLGKQELEPSDSSLVSNETLVDMKQFNKDLEELASGERSGDRQCLCPPSSFPTQTIPMTWLMVITPGAQCHQQERKEACIY